MVKEVEHCKKVVKTKFNKPLIMTVEDEANFEVMNYCHICGNKYTDKSSIYVSTSITNLGAI